MKKALPILLVHLIVLPSVSAQTEQPELIDSDEIVRRLSDTEVRSRGLVKVNDESSAPTVVFNNILFSLDSATLDGSSQDQLEQLRQALIAPELREKKFEISGHTDGTGDASYNRQLSVRRAEAVAEYLLAMPDLTASRLTVVGRGEDHLLPNVGDDDARQRRVEIRSLSISDSTN